MALAETTKNLLTTIAENQPKVKQQGYDEGKQVGVDETKLAIWNAITAYGARIHYARTFYEGDYTDFTFPKPIKVKGTAGRMFFNYRGTKLPRKEDIDLSEVDVSSTSNDDNYSIHNIFGWASKITFIPDYGIPAPEKYFLNFNNCLKVVEIEKIRSKETTIWDRAFQNDKALTTLKIEGVIGTNFEIKDSPLSIASLKSIITHLKPYYGTDKEFTYTLTVKTSAWEALEEAGFTDEDYQWVLDTWGTPPNTYDSWETLMGGWLGWNLVLA